MTIAGWPWRPDLCPADLHFGEYVEAQTKPFESVIHVGTGLHHHVGLLLGSKDVRVIGLTISQEEVDAWRDLERRPLSYAVILRDIRDPAYVRIGQDGISDAFTLFHLGETPAAEGQRSDREVILFAAARAREVFFYAGSYGFPTIEPVIYELVAAGVFRDPKVWRSLMICKVRHG